MSTMTSDRHLPVYARASSEQAQRYAELTQQGVWDLTEAEVHWRDRQPYLEAHGYSMRPRYCPGWTPSWLGTNRHPMFCEDSLMLMYYHIVDAIRARDGRRVTIKRVPNDTSEISMARSLATTELLQNPINHCIPILDILPDPFDKNESLMIMPYLRPFNDPEFYAIGEVVDFIRQTLEGLTFLHNRRIAHRDCAAANIMMDGRPLYPQDHHPIRKNHTVDAIYEVSHLARIDHPVQYYFIDFEISVHIPEGTPPLVVGRIGRDKSVPELSFDVPYDAFKVDIYALGNLYDQEFLQKYYGLDFLQPLIDTMKDIDPTRRPTAEFALALFESIRAGLNDTLLRWRLRARTESAPERVVYDTVAVAREGLYQIKRFVT
ncbi:kinase-like domain-containing protein [Amylocystis lapponica]|nr:kinase-like domain-containing protein [Amylocystis lapponica]